MLPAGYLTLMGVFFDLLLTASIIESEETKEIDEIVTKYKIESK